ncbi:hypothetical protein ACHAPX_000043 [Trichoderma viride]
MAKPTGIDQLTGLVNGLSLDSIAEKYPQAHPEINPLDFYRAHVSNVLAGISGVDSSIIFPAMNWTTGLDKGDFVLAVPALRIKGQKPDALATKWAEEFPAEDPLFDKPTTSGSFMSFFLKGAPLSNSLIPMIRNLGEEYGRNRFNGLRDPKDPSQGKKRILVEFSSPNVAKPFHAGHLRSTIIGSFLANLYEGSGWEVVRINYLGDWGKQYGLLALAYEKYGNEEALQKDPIDHLFKLYVQINSEMTAEKETIEAQKKEGKDVAELEAKSLDEQARRYFKRMTDRDEDVLKQWQIFRDLSIKRYKETYSRLNIAFDSYSGESQVSEEAMAKIAVEMEEKNISRVDNGATLVDFTKLLPGKEGKRLGVTVIRFDNMIYVVASAQDLHLKQLFEIIGQLGYKDIANRCQHINFGLVLGMSTRKGTVKFLDDILRDCADHMHETMRKNEDKYAQVENPTATADILGISSVMVQDMSGKRINNYTFNMEAMTSFEGDTGPYLQYAHSRLCSIKRRANLTEEDLLSADLSLLTEQHATNVVRMLSQWPDTVKNTLKTLEPTTVLTYLFKMSHAVSSSYDHLQVVGSEKELMKARMALYDAARIVLSNGMKLLGLTPLQRM